MRYRKALLRTAVKHDLRVEFSEPGLTSFAGLELLIRYLRSIHLNELIGHQFRGVVVPGDYSLVGMVRLLLGLVIVGGRRLRHVEFLRGDGLFERFCALRCLPSERTISRWLKHFSLQSVERLQALNAVLVARLIHRQLFRALTVDVDGSVVSTGLRVERAFRGFNPHHRKVPSYYPITAYLAETGQILRVKNRSGNVHDGKASITFLRDLFAQIQETVGSTYRLTFRMDGAFFHPKVLHLLKTKGAGFSIKVPFWKWLDLTRLIKERRRWQSISREIGCFDVEMPLEVWNQTLRVVIYRKKVFHRSRKNYQLDLFDPDDGYYEYSAIATNLSLRPRQLWNFMAGRGEHEKVIGQLKGHLAFNTIPTNHYGANSAWQQLVAIAHNLLVGFQIDTGAPRRHQSEKHTCLYELKTAQSLRFELFNRAGRIVRPHGVTVLRLSSNHRYRDLFTRTAQALKAA